MLNADHHHDELLREHRALLLSYGRAQAHCSRQIREQLAEIDRLEAQAMRLRAAVLARDTALAWALEDRAALKRSIPGLPKRIVLARRVELLLQRVQELMRERWRGVRTGLVFPRVSSRDSTNADAVPINESVDAAASKSEQEALEASLGLADLVICQTGCLSHDDYWRVHDHCRRTGKACVLVERPQTLRIVRIQVAKSDA